MNYNLENYYYHTISKDDVKQVLEIFEKVLKEGELKSQQLLGKEEEKFNGLNHISLAYYTKNSKYKTFIIDKDNYEESKLSCMFNDYNSYLEYMKLDNKLEKPISKEEFFIKNNTSNKRDYYNYLDSISRTYPVDISYLYKLTNDKVYKYILKITEEDILYCYKSDNCFDEYIRKSKGITFVFLKTIEVEDVNIIPNLPTDVEIKLVKTLSKEKNRYSNQMCEVQVKDSIDINEAIGIIISDAIDYNMIKKILIENEYAFKIFRLTDKELIEI